MTMNNVSDVQTSDPEDGGEFAKTQTWMREMVLGVRFVRLDETVSTNDLAHDPVYRHGDVILAERQSSGRGQSGNTWQSETARNLTFSLILEPRFLPAAQQFLLSEAVSLGIADALDELGFAAEIKWPNDLLIGGRKTAGILIENDLYGATLARSVVGVGFNVNQRQFPASVAGATSPAVETGHDFDRDDVLRRIYKGILTRYGQLERGQSDAIQTEYHRKLFRVGKPSRFRSAAEGEFTGIIRRVDPSGELHVAHPDGNVRSYVFQEIEFLAPERP